MPLDFFLRRRGRTTPPPPSAGRLCAQALAGGRRACGPRPLRISMASARRTATAFDHGMVAIWLSTVNQVACSAMASHFALDARHAVRNRGWYVGEVWRSGTLRTQGNARKPGVENKVLNRSISESIAFMQFKHISQNIDTRVRVHGSVRVVIVICPGCARPWRFRQSCQFRQAGLCMWIAQADFDFFPSLFKKERKMRGEMNRRGKKEISHIIHITISCI